jgi:hypothetical protein
MRRTLVDLLSNDHGYVRIYAERDGFAYELSTYAPRPTPDLFEKMGGYASLDAACAAAQAQLSAVRHASARHRRRTALRPLRRSRR